MITLTDTQLVILSAAAQRQDFRILPHTKSLSTNKGAMTRVINGLIRKGLAAKVPATRDDQIWREDGDQRYAVVITDKGLDAIGVVDVEASPDADGVVQAEAKPDSVHQANLSANQTSPHRTGAKRAVVIDFLQRNGGASISDLMEKTGWQAHSVRGFISGTLKRKLGLTITSRPGLQHRRAGLIGGVWICPTEIGQRWRGRLPGLAVLPARSWWRSGNATIATIRQRASRRLLVPAIGYALQAKRYGGIKPGLERCLKRIAEAGMDLASTDRQSGLRLKVGTRLIREWHGVTHVVEVMEDGFLWNGEKYRSLSATARAITGARWSGPRFFGTTSNGAL